MDLMQEPAEPKLHDWIIQPKKKKLVQCEQPPKIAVQKKSKTPGPPPISWTVSDISKAGCLLTQPPKPTTFEDEQEMRRVYTLIYNVFRHKNVLTQALNDIGFFEAYPELEQTISHIWLLFYDLYHRSFKKRETKVVNTAKKLFKDSGLTKAEEALWEYRTKLAAAVARLRIQHNALSLSDLLPPHLQDDKVPGYGTVTPVTCWVNLKKVKNIDELKRRIEEEFDLRPVEDREQLGPENYRWDKHCPHIVAFHGSLRTKLARSEFVKNFMLVVQDRSFCLGPATFVKHVTQLELAGSVIQTHINSPRTTAYLATILSQNEKIKKLMAFSAGQRKMEYEDYFNQLGMTNVAIFADRLIDVSPDAPYMEEVVAVFATPPNSYSAVNDPIDLVCSRGGDLSMLEILTEAEESDEGRERVCRILDEQRKTLRFAMSRPQIQFVLYETHSGIDAENKGMVDRTVKEVNKIAKLHHATLQGKLIVPIFIEPPSDNVFKEINNNEKISVEDKNKGEVMVETVRLTLDSDDKLFSGISVPETDIFDVPDLPHLCPSETSCINYTKEGCYLALLQRKEVIRLDNKYMIQMAENRGLFGRTSSSSTRTKGSKGPRKKQEKPPTPPLKNRRRIKDVEVARIAAPTHTFLRHIKDNCDIEVCSRCKTEHNKEENQKSLLYKQWWSETTHHIMSLRSTLIKNKVLPSRKSNNVKPINAKTVVDAFVYNSTNNKIDEIVAKSRGVDNTSIPLFPKLKLPRENKIEKVQLRIPVMTLELVQEMEGF